MTRFLSNMDRAEVLLQALPYIQQYVGKVVVIKYGGNAAVDEHMREQVMEDIVLLWAIGVKVVLVHGGGPEISSMMDKFGKESEFVEGLRVTDDETMDIVQMVLSGKMNKNLVNLLAVKGGRAIGLSGVDGHLIEAEKKDERLGFVGDITGINIDPVEGLLKNNYIPVISTVGCDDEGNSYNINGDTAAAYLAGALNAERLIMMTNISGILEDQNDPDSLIRELTVDEAKGLYDSGIVSGGMIPKVDCCINATEMGVQGVVILDGRVPHAILMELLTNEGAGTRIRKND
ncbi:MAG: acetylglutamate kinase [Lachnospiraceae bacterium]|nr:acetylglutamate kinase [Lachnospiraceae bacterium]MDO4734365.1 acetylglutamate kinase [Lachnospiraceae bacterium]